MPVTLKDIAEELNISINAVSRALRNMPDIGPETTKKVYEAAQRLGYRFAFSCFFTANFEGPSHSLFEKLLTQYCKLAARRGTDVLLLLLLIVCVLQFTISY